MLEQEDKGTIFLVSMLTLVGIVSMFLIHDAFAQEVPPPLEKPTAESETPIPTLGKITIQISQTEQIIIDLPLKSENKYQVVPIK